MKNSRKLFLTSLCGLAAVGIYACGGGQQGEPGAAGAKGDSCSVVTKADGTATIKCTDGSSFNIVNGKDANPGDAGSDGKDGQNGKSCYLTENIDGSAAVVCPYDGSSYIVRGNTDNYANYCKKGFWGKNCENECNCNEHQDCNDGVTGDGSCSCKDNWSDEDCSVCPAGFYDGVTECVDCTKGVANSAFGSEKCTFTDSRDGQVYNVVKIGDQVWMAENMRDETDVSCIKDPSNTDWTDDYGCLYTWEDANKACPSGWRLPNQEDFEQLLTTTGADSNSSILRDSSWGEGANSSGFGALPAGLRWDDGDFDGFGSNALFWSSSPNGNAEAYYLYVRSNDADVFGYNRNYAFSVHCLRDEG